MTTSTDTDIPSPRHWARVPTGIFRLGLTFEQIAGVIVLLGYCRAPNKLVCWPSLAAISTALGLPESKRYKPARRVMDELAATGLVTVTETRDARGHRVRAYDVTALWIKAVAATNDLPDEAELPEPQDASESPIIPEPIAPTQKTSNIRSRFGGAKLPDADPPSEVAAEPLDADTALDDLEAQRAALEAAEAEALAELEAIRACRTAR